MVPVHQTGRVLTKACRGVESGEWREGEKANKGACQKGLRHRQATRDAHSTGGGEERRSIGSRAHTRRRARMGLWRHLLPFRPEGALDVRVLLLYL